MKINDKSLKYTAPTLMEAAEMVPLGSLVENQNNPKLHTTEQVVEIAKSIKSFKFNDPIITNDDYEILEGHGRLMAAKQLGMSHVPVLRLGHMTLAQQSAYLVTHNKLNLMTDMAFDKLAPFEDSIKAFDFIGFNDNEINILTGGLFESSSTDDGGVFNEDQFTNSHTQTEQELLIPFEDTEPEDVFLATPKPINKLGDVWLLGQHRLMCGDSTDSNHFDLLMGTELADMVFTDPPYGVSYADKNKTLNKADKGNKIQTPIENDHIKGDDLQGFFKNVFTCLNSKMKLGCAFYVFCAPGDLELPLMQAMKDCLLPIRHGLVWVKNNIVLGRSDYHYKHEIIFYGWKQGAAHTWNGERNKNSVWEFPKLQKNDLHPTMKPVALIEFAVKNSSNQGDIILDPFLGSGSTMIACENTGRVCYGLELSPEYCDVIIKRWQNLTGKDAILESTGEIFNSLLNKEEAHA